MLKDEINAYIHYFIYSVFNSNYIKAIMLFITYAKIEIYLYADINLLDLIYHNLISFIISIVMYYLKRKLKTIVCIQADLKYALSKESLIIMYIPTELHKFKLPLQILFDNQ
jgi:hypothetical protein